MQAIATWFINGVTSLRGQINFNNFKLLKFNISNGAEVPSWRYLELQESSKKPAKLTAWRAFCFSKHTAKPSYAWLPSIGASSGDTKTKETVGSYFNVLRT